MATEFKQVTVYECRYCKKLIRSKGWIKRHEKYCGRNPENDFACFLCENLKYEREFYGFRENGRNKVRKHFYCEAQNSKEMHTHVAERRGLELCKRTERMPLKCNLFELGTHHSRSI